MARFKLYVRGCEVPPDENSIAVNLEGLMDRRADIRWAVHNLTRLLDPNNVKTNQKAVDRIKNELVTRSPRLAETLDILQDCEPVEVDVVTDDVTTTLLRVASKTFADELDNHFILTEQSIEINPEDPPSIDKCYKAVIHLVNMRNTGARLTDFATWRLGALIDACDCYHGESFNISQVVEATSLAYNTIITCLRVFREFGMDRFNLPYTIHKEVFYRDMPKEDKLRILRIAEEKDMKCAEVRKLCSYIQHTDKPFEKLDGEVMESKHSLMEHVTVRSGARRFFFLLNGEFHMFKGHLTEIPEAAGTVIDVGLNAYVNHRDPDSPPKKLIEWKPTDPTPKSPS